MAKVIRVFKNKTYGLEAILSETKTGTYTVLLKDCELGKALDAVRMFPTIKEALASVNNIYKVAFEE